MNEENQTIIRAINKFGRVPENWELLNMMDELQERIDRLKNEISADKMEQFDDYVIYLLEKYIEILEGEGNE